MKTYLKVVAVIIIAVLALSSVLVAVGYYTDNNTDTTTADSTIDPTAIELFVKPSFSFTYSDTLADTGANGDITVMSDGTVYQYVGAQTIVKPILDTTDPTALLLVGSWYAQNSFNGKWENVNSGYDFLNSITNLSFVANDLGPDNWLWTLKSSFGVNPVPQFPGIDKVFLTDGSILADYGGTITTTYNYMPTGEVQIQPSEGDNIVFDIMSWDVWTINEPGWQLVHQGTGNGSGNGGGNGNGNGNGGASDWWLSTVEICGHEMALWVLVLLSALIGFVFACLMAAIVDLTIHRKGKKKGKK